MGLRASRPGGRRQRPGRSALQVPGGHSGEGAVSVPAHRPDPPPGECIGALVVQTLTPSSYTTDKIELLTTIASAVSGVIRTAQLYKNSREQLAALTAISEISQALISTLDLDRLLNLIVEKSVNLLNARGAILRLLNPETQTLEIRASYGLPPDIARSRALAFGEGIAGRVAVERRPVRIDDASRDPLAAAVGLFKSIVCVPLISKNQILGTLALYDKGGDLPGPFSERDEYLLVTVGRTRRHRRGERPGARAVRGPGRRKPAAAHGALHPVRHRPGDEHDGRPEPPSPDHPHGRDDRRRSRLQPGRAVPLRRPHPDAGGRPGRGTEGRGGSLVDLAEDLAR